LAQVQLNQYFEALIENPSGVRSLGDLIKFNDAHAELEEPAGYENQSVYVFHLFHST
jgi:amidase